MGTIASRIKAEDLTPTASEALRNTAEVQSQPKLVAPWLRVLFIALGGFFLGLGVIGIYLPGIPTTPFVLLASFFFVRSSPKLNDRIERMPVVGGYLLDWNQKKGVKLHVKVLALLSSLIVVAFAIFFGSGLLWVKFTIVTLAIIGQAVVWSLKTVR